MKAQTKAKATRFTARRQLLAVAIATCFASGVHALPTVPVVVNGSASFATTGSTLNVTNSNGAIINWQSFGIAAGETTRFIQASAASRVLNNVVGVNGVTQMSQIYGTLSSNGQVWLVNPAGIVVGAGGVVDTAGFIASTLKIRPEDFLANQLKFQATPGAGDVINQGTIRTPSGGSVYLVGSNVGNEGLITTPNGETILAAGATVELIDTGTPGVKVAITGSAGNATNLGQIVAEAGRIGIAGGIVRNSGTLDASSVVNEGGRIFLKASQDTYVDGNGRIVATGTKGGQVEVLGNRVAVMDNAGIDASGTNGGGTILVGGDYQGKNPGIQNANVTYFGPDAILKANATESGDGGKVIVWADDTTRAYGRIEAKGGPNGGNGGFVETSGHNYLDVGGIYVDTRASDRGAGNWLLDPVDILIVHGASGAANFSPTSNSTITDGTINNALTTTNVTVTSNAYGGTGGTGLISFDGLSGGDIAIDSGAANRTLTFDAASDIRFTAGTTTFRSTGPYSFSVFLDHGAGRQAIIQSGASLVLDGASGGTVVADAASATWGNWLNQGTVTLNGKSVIDLNTGLNDTFNNAAGATLNINSSNQWSVLSEASSQSAILSNDGVINVQGAYGVSGNYTAWEAQYTQSATGTLHVGAGKVLSMQNVSQLSGVVNVDAGGRAVLTQQVVNYPQISNVVISGPGWLDIMSLQGLITFSNVTLNGGTIVSSTGGLTVPAGITSYSGNVGFMAAGGITFIAGNFSGLGDLRLVAGWDGSSSITAPLTPNNGGISLPSNTFIDAANVYLYAGGTGTISQVASPGSIVADSLYARSGAGTISLQSFANQIGTFSAQSTNQTITFNGQSVGLGSINSGTGSTTISATYDIHDQNGSANNITAGSVSLYSTYGGSAGTLAISADTSTTAAGNITASVSNSATHGGIRISNTVSVAPANVSMGDNSTNGGPVSLKFIGNIDDAVTAVNLNPIKGDLALFATGNLLESGNIFVNIAPNYAVSLGAGGDLTTANSMGLAFPNNPLSLASGNTLNINGTIEVQDLLLVAPTINVNSPGSASSFNNLIMITDNYRSTGGYLHAADDVLAVIGQDVKLDSGAKIEAGNEVFLTLAGSSSTLALNTGSTIEADSPATIYLDFLGRSSGGILLDGLAPVAPSDYSSYFYNDGIGATPGNGLIITFAQQQSDPCALSPEICNPKPPEPPIVVGGCAGTQAGCAPPPGEDTGGGEGEFGEGENKGKKKVGKCRG